jgi:hypothetical protein
MTDIFDEVLNSALDLNPDDLPPGAQLTQLDAMANCAFKAANRWADEAAFAAERVTDDARTMPAAMLGMTIAAALHYAASLHADAISDLADAIREVGERAAGTMKGEDHGK